MFTHFTNGWHVIKFLLISASFSFLGTENTDLKVYVDIINLIIIRMTGYTICKQPVLHDSLQNIGSIAKYHIDLACIFIKEGATGYYILNRELSSYCILNFTMCA